MLVFQMGSRFDRVWTKRGCKLWKREAVDRRNCRLVQPSPEGEKLQKKLKQRVLPEVNQQTELEKRERKKRLGGSPPPRREGEKDEGGWKLGGGSRCTVGGRRRQSKHRKPKKLPMHNKSTIYCFCAKKGKGEAKVTPIRCPGGFKGESMGAVRPKGSGDGRETLWESR